MRRKLQTSFLTGYIKRFHPARSMLELGSSKPWPDAMEKITGQRKMNSSGLLEYFKPLMDWLKLENEKNSEYIGWKPTKRGKSLVSTLN